MGKFYVVNDLKQDTIIVREGSGSTFFQVKSILPGQQHVVHVDSKATCREFLLVLEKLPEKLQEKFNSDECLECAEVRITGYNASRLICKKIPKISRDVSGMITDANLSNAWQSIGSNVLRFFGKGGKRRAPATQTDGSASTSGSSPTGGSAPDDGSAPTGGSAPFDGNNLDDGSAPTGGSVINKQSDADGRS